MIHEIKTDKRKEKSGERRKWECLHQEGGTFTELSGRFMLIFCWAELSHSDCREGVRIAFLKNKKTKKQKPEHICTPKAT